MEYDKNTGNQAPRENRIGEGAVRELLERWFEGETSVGEERLLKEYFAQAPDVPADLEYARAMFGHFSEAACEVSTSVFVPAENDAAGEIPTSPKRRSRRVWAWAASAAAVVVLALTIDRMPETVNGETVYCYVDGQPVTDFEEAYRYMQEAMDILSDNIQKPAEYLEPAQKAGKSLKNLRYLGLLKDMFTDENNE